MFILPLLLMHFRIQTHSGKRYPLICKGSCRYSRPTTHGGALFAVMAATDEIILRITRTINKNDNNNNTNSTNNGNNLLVLPSRLTASLY